ncbi:TPA: hypothetical protein N0F65_007049 [Lagenidium giganteum]|uniref:PX domain-containing protein n=1 Tax=Lagenidium giganteum TaxID=4803 RepID=A0AAV2YWM1_9STRA|nr:TPA: hypothetical protein N0F65_007049 [Lagenidium giganteum]
MSGVVHVLSASITSALVIKPSTVYILRVENRKTRHVWHLRRCFTDFSDLREKLLTLIESSQLVESKTRFPHVHKQFPKRQFFGSRTKKVIEHRTNALNAFLTEALAFVDEIKKQQKIAVYFSMMNYLETFLDCAQNNNSAGSPTDCVSPTSALPVFVAPPFPYIPAMHLPLARANTTCMEMELDEDDEERLVLKKAASAFLHRDLSQMREEYNVSPVSTDASVPAPVADMHERSRGRSRSAADAWAARIEIAGLSATRLREKTISLSPTERASSLSGDEPATIVYSRKPKSKQLMAKLGEEERPECP